MPPWSTCSFALMMALLFTRSLVTAATVQCNTQVTIGDAPLVMMQSVITVYAPAAVMRLVTFQGLQTSAPMLSNYATQPRAVTSQNITTTQTLYGTSASQRLYAQLTSAVLCSVSVFWPLYNNRNNISKSAMLTSTSASVIGPTLAPANTGFTLVILLADTPANYASQGYTLLAGVSTSSNCSTISQYTTASGSFTSYVSMVVNPLPLGVYSVCMLIQYNNVNKTRWFPLALALGSSSANLQVGVSNTFALGIVSVSQDPALSGTAERLLYGVPLTLYMDANIITQATYMNYYAVDTSLDLCNPDLISSFTRSQVVALNSSTYAVNTTVYGNGPNGQGGGVAILCGAISATGPWMQLSTNSFTMYACRIGYRTNNGSCTACQITGPGPTDYCYRRGVCGYGTALAPDFTSTAVTCDCNKYFDVGGSTYYGIQCQLAYLRHPRPSLLPNRTYSGSRIVTFTAADTNETVFLRFANGTTVSCVYSCTLKFSQTTLIPAVTSINYTLLTWTTHINGSATLGTQNVTYVIAPLTRSQSKTPTPTKSWSVAHSSTLSNPSFSKTLSQEAATRSSTSSPTSTPSATSTESPTSTLSYTSTSSRTLTASPSTSVSAASPTSSRASETGTATETLTSGSRSAPPASTTRTSTATVSRTSPTSVSPTVPIVLRRLRTRTITVATHTATDTASLSPTMTTTMSISMTMPMTTSTSASGEVTESSTRARHRTPSLTLDPRLVPSVCTDPDGQSFLVADASVTSVANPAGRRLAAVDATLPSAPASLQGSSLPVANWPCSTACVAASCTGGLSVDCRTASIVIESPSRLAAALLSGIDPTCNVTMPLRGFQPSLPSMSPGGPPATSPAPPGPNTANGTAGGTMDFAMPIVLHCAPIRLENVWLPVTVMADGLMWPIVVVGYDPARGLMPMSSTTTATTDDTIASAALRYRSQVVIAVVTDCTSPDALNFTDLAGNVVLRNDAAPQPLYTAPLISSQCLRFRVWLDRSTTSIALHPTVSDVTVPRLGGGIQGDGLPAPAPTPSPPPPSSSSTPVSSPSPGPPPGDTVAPQQTLAPSITGGTIFTSPPLSQIPSEAPRQTAPGTDDNGTSFTSVPGIDSGGSSDAGGGGGGAGQRTASASGSDDARVLLRHVGQSESAPRMYFVSAICATVLAATLWLHAVGRGTGLRRVMLENLRRAKR